MVAMIYTSYMMKGNSQNYLDNYERCHPERVAREDLSAKVYKRQNMKKFFLIGLIIVMVLVSACAPAKEIYNDVAEPNVKNSVQAQSETTSEQTTSESASSTTEVASTKQASSTTEEVASTTEVVSTSEESVVTTTTTLESTSEQTTETEGEAMSEKTLEKGLYADITMENGGKITIKLLPEHAPKTVENFQKLANEGFYEGLIFHRVINGFMIQGGDPTGTGMGGSEETIIGEFTANGVDNALSHKRGVISMARSQNMNSASSQFFIVHQDSLFLDGQYAAFGEVVSGMEVVDAIASVETDPSDKPLTEQKMSTVEVYEVQ